MCAHNQYEIVQRHIKEHLIEKKLTVFKKLTFEDIMAISLKASEINGKFIDMEYILQSIAMLSLAHDDDGDSPYKKEPGS